jgi:DNA-binding NtrC family response regulator/tetratricopeptide (TPR) repeat protein
LARQSTDLHQLCWSLLFQLPVVTERSGPDATRPILAELRLASTKLGDSRTAAAIHLFLGEIEAKRGLFSSALHHIGVGRRLLRSAPNVWLEAYCENTQLAIGILRSDFKAARIHGERAVEAAKRSGSAATLRASIGNMGNLCYALGDLDGAIDYFTRSERALPTEGEKTSARLDSIARISLTQGHLGQCEAYLERIDKSIKSPKDRFLNGNRSAVLTRALLLNRLGRNEEALAQVELTSALARQAGDAFLALVASLTRAEILQQTGHVPEAVTLLTTLLPDLIDQSPELYAQNERILACALARQGRANEAQTHYERARRIHVVSGCSSGLLESERCWREAQSASFPEPDTELTTGATAEEHWSERTILHSVAALILHSDRPELVASEALTLLDATRSVHQALVISRRPDGVEDIVARIGSVSDEGLASSPPRRMPIGFSHGHAIEILATVKPDTESVATVNALALLISGVHDLQRARMEREERTTLWPVDELPIESDRAVVAGNMLEQMKLARKIARTNVNVLITGESGTGKDLLARAIHEYSDRAHKPFVAFNCSTIPRDLLESQLFGHRRGAFTGADRDHIGVIRTAREGTLFLDEVGDLGLDLQPKLLRFLESGEIAPLGEPSLNVNVRIVAATNSNLEDAVSAGRFREDLFYRLNVVRLSLKPLRERRDEIPSFVRHFVELASEEFQKGRVRISDELMEHLTLCRWPGNVRQLQNEVRRMIAVADPGTTLKSDCLSSAENGGLPRPSTMTSDHQIQVSLQDKLQPTLARVECEMIKTALAEHRGRVDAVAKSLGISRKGLYLKRQRFGL